MSKKSQRRQPDSPIQFRPGALLGDVIDRWAKTWKISCNETARRLASLAAAGLDHRHHAYVCQLANLMCGNADFSEACERIRVELHAIESAREEAMDSRERDEQIFQIVQRASFEGNPDETTKTVIRLTRY